MSSLGDLIWHLRPISDSDFEWCFALHRDALGAYVTEIWGWDPETQRRMFTERVAEQSRQVIEVDGERVGVLEVDDRPDELYLALIELSPSWQGKGLGTEVLRSVIGQAERSGKPLALHALRSNPRACAFYKREGLHVAGVEPTKFLMRTR